MDWESLKFALALGREGTMTGAARELGVNHSTVSRRIAALQDEVGVKLFISTANGWQPTAAGQQFVNAAADMQQRAHDATRAALGHAERVEGTLRIAGIDSMFSWLAEDFRAFVGEYPGIRLELAAHNMPANLTRREADVAIRATNRPPETLVGRRVATAGYAAYAARSLAEPIYKGSDFTDEQLSRLPWIAWDERLGAVVTERWIAAHAGADRIIARYDSVPVILDHTAVGMGAACLPCYMVESRPEFQRLTPVLDGFEIDIWLLTHSDLRRSARVRAFMDFFDDAFSSRAAEIRDPT